MKNYIQELLYDQNSVIIPAFGGFVTSYKPASIDHVQGVIFPPSKELKFNRYLTINDGVFVQHLCNEKGWIREEAEQAIRIWVMEMQEKLERREMIEFPNVGRLYLDYEGNFQFLPDNTNYNTSSYGLPTIGFYPVTRSRQNAKRAAAEPRQNSTILDLGTKSDKDNVIPIWLRRNIHYIVAASFLIFAGTFLLLDNDKSTSQAGLAPFIKPVSAERVNTKPIRTEEQTDIKTLYEEDTIDEDAMIDNGAEEDDVLVETKKAQLGIVSFPTKKEEKKSEVKSKAKINPKKDIDTEGATVAPDQKEAIVIIGSFGNAKNAEKLVEKVYNLGYEPFTVKKDGLNKVGVRFSYKTVSQVKKKRRKVAKDFKVNAWVMQPKLK